MIIKQSKVEIVEVLKDESHKLDDVDTRKSLELAAKKAKKDEEELIKQNGVN